MHTGGIGGDSLVQLDGSLQIGPVRVTPLALATDLPAPANWLGVHGGCRLIMVRPEAVDELPDNDLGRLLRDRGHLTPATIRRQTGLGGVPLDRQLEELARRQLVVSCGFTPTDALHVLNQIAIGCRAPAVAGAELLGAPLGLSAADFARKVLQETEKKIENLILAYLARRFWGDSLGTLLAGRTDHPVLAVDFTLRLPLVGIGAAAPALLPGVAKRLRTTVSFPEHGEVGNAIGAALIGLAGDNPAKTERPPSK